MTSDRTIQQQFEAFIESIFFYRNNILFGLVGVAVLLVAGRYVLMARLKTERGLPKRSDKMNAAGPVII